MTLAMGEEISPVAFPQDYSKGIMYFKNDRGSITEEIYVNADAVKSLQQGKPLPSGTVITLVEYFAQDLKGSDGYALKGDLKRYVVMEKRSGWGQNRPTSLRNGEWEYQAFNPDKTIQKNEDIERCFSCHHSEQNHDYVFTLNAIRNITISQ